MKAPTIDLSTIPGLETAQGLFGSAGEASGMYEDSIIAIMVVVYEVAPSGLLG